MATGEKFLWGIVCWMSLLLSCPAHRGDDVKDCPIFSVTCPLWLFSHRVKLHTHSVAGLAGQFIQSVGVHCPHCAAPAQYNIAVSTVHWLPEIQQLQICVRSQVQSLWACSCALLVKIKKTTLEPNDPSNSRLISSLPFLSKLLEKAVF